MKTKPRIYLFRCGSCKTVISLEFETKEDFDLILADKVEVECPCGGLLFNLKD